MVQLRESLEVLVLQAWRERWSELEWSINLKQVMVTDTAELHKLCDLLLRQATLSEVPNRLMFTYLHYSVAAQVVSHTSLIDAIVQYRHFHRGHCIEAIIEELNRIRDKIRCNSADIYECEQLSAALLRLINWLIDGIAFAMANDNAALFVQFNTITLLFLLNPFVAVLLHFQSYYNPDNLNSTMNRLTTLTLTPSMVEPFKSLLPTTDRKLRSIGTDTSIITIDYRDPTNAHPCVMSLAAVFGSFRVTKPYREVADALTITQCLMRVPWWLMLSDLVRGALLILLDPGVAARESTITAFIYLKLPRIVRELVTIGVVDIDQVVRALEHLCTYHSMLNSLDSRTKFDCFHNLLEQMKSVELLRADQIESLIALRKSEQIYVSEPVATNNQQGIQLVLRAEKTVSTVERSFNSEMVLNPEKLVQMMSHMILSGGKSFDYICASSAATGKLSSFAGKLMFFNKVSETASPQNDKGKTRATMFDLSFTLLTRIRHLYTDMKLSEMVQGADASSHCFFKWSQSYADLIDSNNQPAPIISADAKADFADRMALLKKGTPHWNVQTCDWSDVVLTVPIIGDLLLDEFKDGKQKDDEVALVFSTLNEDVSCLLLCLVQWLHAQPHSDARLAFVRALNNFFESHTPEEAHAIMYRTEERWRFMVATTRQTMDTMLSVVQLRGPPFTWLIHCARRQLPCASRFQVPDNDTLKQAFTYAQRQSWASPSVLALVDRCNKAGEHSKWCAVWINSLIKLYTADEISAATELCIGVAMLDPQPCLLAFTKLIVDYVLDDGHELYCVAPRGTILAQFLIRALVLAVHMQLSKNGNETITKGSGTDGGTKTIDEHSDDDKSALVELGASSAKKCRIDDATSVMDIYSDGQPGIFADGNGADDAVRELFSRFLLVTMDGELKPTVSFVVNCLRTLADNSKCTAAQHIISMLPHSLMVQVVRTDPKSLSPSVIMALYNLNERTELQRALGIVCLLRHLRAI